MTSLVLYCKSFATDLRRVVRLARSVQSFNAAGLDFYVSVPGTEVPLFQEHLSSFGVEVLSDDEILRASPRIDVRQVQGMPGHLAQQVIKSEFWRLGISDAYLCLDSDSIFIRPFDSRDYMSADGTPYFVMSEAQGFLEQSLTQGKRQVVENFHREAGLLQGLFNRPGKAFSYGPMPIVWHTDVWRSLDRQFLTPKGMNFVDAIQQAPLESRWYGEALLKYKAIDLMPSEPFFKVYHYAWQLDEDRRMGMDIAQLATLYSGVIYQSSWEREMDWPHEGGGLASRLGRRIRRALRRI
jgi:hypothetical protein